MPKRINESTLRVVARQLVDKFRSGSLAPEAVALRSDEGMTAALVAFARTVEQSVREMLVAADMTMVCSCGTTMVCPDLGCTLHKAAAVPQGDGGGYDTVAPLPAVADELRYNQGALDDVVINDVQMFRMERMNKDTWWMRLYMRDKDDIVFGVTTTGREIIVTAEFEPRR